MDCFCILFMFSGGLPTLYMYICMLANVLIIDHECVSQEPKSITLGTRLVTIGSGRRRRSQMKKDVMVYVPILKTLKVLLQDKAIRDEV